MTGIGTTQVAAIVVAYEPDVDALQSHVQSVATQVAHVYVIDNSETKDAQRDVSSLANTRVAVETLGRNFGIAHALNRGIELASAAGATHVLLLDQDSQPDAAMVATLLAALERAGSKVAAIGPTQMDARTGRAAPFVQFGFPMNRKFWPAPGETVDCDFLITSGSLVPLAAFHAIGPFDAALFIDNVDMEWSHRAYARGYRLLGCADARMTHALGDRLVRRPGGHAAVHSPRRLYYMMRNRLHLYGRDATPAVWVAQDIPRLLLKLTGFSLFVAPRLANSRAMWAGLRDGLRGRLGPHP